MRLRRSRQFVFFAIFFSTLLYCTAAFATTATDAQLAYDRGEALAQQGDVAGAIEAWQAVSSCSNRGEPVSPIVQMIQAQALTSIAEAQRGTHDLDSAISTASTVLSDYSESRSQCVDAALIKAKSYQAKQDYTAALEMYKTILRAYPDKINRAEIARGRVEDIRGLCNLSDQGKQDLADAIATYETAKAEEDSVTAARRAAKTKADSGDVTGAKADLARSYPLLPSTILARG